MVLVCDTPSTISNGMTTMSSDEQVVDYTCDLGFTLSGDSRRLCSTQGNGWTGSQPSCGNYIVDVFITALGPVVSRILFQVYYVEKLFNSPVVFSH